MNNRIVVYRGSYKNFRIANTTFKLLKPLMISNGETTAWVDASDVLGKDFSKVLISIEDYKCL